MTIKYKTYDHLRIEFVLLQDSKHHVHPSLGDIGWRASQQGQRTGRNMSPKDNTDLRGLLSLDNFVHYLFLCKLAPFSEYNLS